MINFSRRQREAIFQPLVLFCFNHKYNRVKVLLWLIIAMQACLVWIGASQLSPTPDESAHLAAGIEYWRNGNLELYNVNPPLVKLWVSLPHVICGITVPQLPSHFQNDPSLRREFLTGKQLMRSLGSDAIPWLVVARRMGILFSLMGTLGVFTLSNLLVNSKAGILAATLWALNPNVLGHSQVVSCDIPAAAMGCWAVVGLVLASRLGSIFNVVIVGAILGLAILTKFTWIAGVILFPIGLVAMGCRFEHRRNGNWQVIRIILATQMVCLMLGVSWLVVATGYRWERMFLPIEQFRFVSQLLRGTTTERVSNRFHGTMLSKCPVPLPAAMVEGVDQQWEDFDQPHLGYLCGRWSKGGNYYYYAAAWIVKMPIGILLLGLLAMPTIIRCRERAFVLFALPLALFTLISLKTNMNEHVRYVWIILPMYCVACCPQKLSFGPVWRTYCTYLLVVWASIAGVSSFPYGISYSNELFGGSTNTWRFLAGSNTDWNHGWLAASEWVKNGAQKHHVAIVASEGVDLDLIGIPSSPTFPIIDIQNDISQDDLIVTLIISVTQRLALERDQAIIFENRKLVGCCIEIYDVRLSQLSGVRIRWFSP